MTLTICSIVCALFLLAAATGSTDQGTSSDRPLGGGKPVKTITIKRCPDGYELVIRTNGRRGCAKDVVPANE